MIYQYILICDMAFLCNKTVMMIKFRMKKADFYPIISIGADLHCINTMLLH